MVYQTIVSTGATDIFMQKEIFIGEKVDKMVKNVKFILTVSMAHLVLIVIYYVRG